jgi:hypothetical protein
VKRCPALVPSLLLVAGCSSPDRTAETPAAPQAVPWELRLAPEALDTGGTSLGPQLTTSPAAGAVMSWMEQQDDTFTLRFAERSPAGQWSAPRSIVSGTDWFVSGVDPPAVMRLRDGSLAAHWYKAVDLATEAYDTLMATSTDDGKTWSRPFSPHHDRTRTQHGFVSLFEWPAAQGGGLGMVWLDGRAGADMGLHNARFDAGGRQTVEAVVNARVCECCPTSVAITSGGPVVAFRDRSADEVRDIHVVRRDADAWADPVPVFASHWQVDSCPVNGPAIAAAGDRVAVAWFEAPGDDGHAYVAFSGDGGKAFGKPVRVDDTASLGNVGIVMLDDGAAAVTWIEFDNGSRFRVRRVEPSGARSAAVQIAGGEGRFVSGIPRIARAGNQLLFAWTETRGEEPVAQQKVTVATAAIP